MLLVGFIRKSHPRVGHLTQYPPVVLRFGEFRQMETLLGKFAVLR
jgi:hypothetical protein